MRLAPLALAAGLLAAPAAALDLTDMTEAEREAFRAEVRAYLLDNPEVLMEAIGVLEQREAETAAEADRQLASIHRGALMEDGHSWTGGNPEGDITIVEFVDYRCGYCRRAHPEVAELVESDGNIRYVIKEFPILGEQSLMASRFAIATRAVAGDDAYKQVSDALITMRADVTPDSLERLGQTLGLDTDAILVEMDSEDTTRVLELNHALAQQMQISGTPTFVFNDMMLRGYAPLPVMQGMVDDLRSEG
ncbi:MAG: Protein-disulfide isomerase [Rhodobacteraceae bacterium HLUCCA08]|nr:MAG: Protein-disulfide isomerase [Rhodobacteraceae bacterium HLUCCA08]